MNRLIALLFPFIVAAPFMVFVVVSNDPAAEYAPAWSPDGSHIAFLRTVAAKHGMLWIPTDGTKPIEILMEEQHTLPAVSPDGAQVAYVEYDVRISIHVMNTDGSQDQRIFEPDMGVNGMVWKPDGSKLLVWDSGKVFTIRPDGSEYTIIASGTLAGFGYVWSPDGTQLAYYSNVQAGQWGIWIIAADGSDANLLLAQPFAEDVAWSPTGDKLAITYPAGDGSLYRAIVVVNADGSNVVELPSQASQYEALTWSPDGSRIAFVRDGDLYVTKIDGSQVSKLTGDEAMDSSPLWSPDGEKIAFLRSQDSQIELYTIDPSDGALSRLTDNNWTETPLGWLPDSSTVFAYSQQEAYGELYHVDVGGGTPVRYSGDLTVGGFAWSPDGSTIAIAANPHNDGSDFYRVNADGENLTQFPIDFRVMDFAWSPDSRYIVVSTYAYQTESDFEYYVMDATGNNLTRLSALAGLSQSAPTWSADSQTLAFANGDYPDVDLYKINLDGSQLTKLLDLSYIEGPPVWSPDGQKLAMKGFREGIPGGILVLDATGTVTDIVPASGDSLNKFTWSPDSTRLAYVTLDQFPLSAKLPAEVKAPAPTAFHLHVINADGGNAETLTTDGSNPVWSFNSKWIAYESSSEGVILAKADNSSEYTLGRWGSRSATWSPVAQHLAFSDGDIHVVSFNYTD